MAHRSNRTPSASGGSSDPTRKPAAGTEIKIRRPTLAQIFQSCPGTFEDRFLRLDPPRVPTSADDITDYDDSSSFPTGTPGPEHGAYTPDSLGQHRDPQPQAGLPGWLFDPNLRPYGSPADSSGELASSSATSTTLPPQTPQPTRSDTDVPDYAASDEDSLSYAPHDAYYGAKAPATDRDYDEPATQSSQAHFPNLINVQAPSDDSHSSASVQLHLQPEVQGRSIQHDGSLYPNYRPVPTEALEERLERHSKATAGLSEQRADGQHVRGRIQQQQQPPRSLTQAQPGDMDGAMERKGRSRMRSKISLLGLSSSGRTTPQHSPSKRDIASTSASPSTSSLYLPLCDALPYTSQPDLTGFGYASPFREPARFSVGSTVLESAPVAKKKPRRFESALERLLSKDGLLSMVRRSKKPEDDTHFNPTSASSSSVYLPTSASPQVRTAVQTRATTPAAHLSATHSSPNLHSSAGLSQSRVTTPARFTNVRHRRDLGSENTLCQIGRHKFWLFPPGSPLVVACENCGKERDMTGRARDVGKLVEVLVEPQF
ncbi:hypothetical protein BKA70DRAFT_1446862 [Coprinopsis sp. MPI-PUGE-AT-0042]|nr:hypothetical protein BKA70DRAFT_1446862 [Coprinopsis sp. MPI-PUGE-AT-0042]